METVIILILMQILIPATTARSITDMNTIQHINATLVKQILATAQANAKVNTDTKFSTKRYQT